MVRGECGWSTVGLRANVGRKVSNPLFVFGDAEPEKEIIAVVEERFEKPVGSDFGSVYKDIHTQILKSGIS